MTRSLPCLLAATALILTLPAVATLAQSPQQQPHRQPGPKAERALAGLPLYSSDGKVIGKVIAMGLDDDNESVLVAEIERSLGFGSTAIAVPVGMFVRKPDRVELTLTEAEVGARLGGPQRKR